MDYDTIDAEVRRLLFELRIADEEAISANEARLRATAERIADDESRRRAVRRAGDLLRLVRPDFMTSPHYREAVALLDLARSFEDPTACHVAEVARLVDRMTQLTREATDREYPLVEVMRSEVTGRLRAMADQFADESAERSAAQHIEGVPASLGPADRVARTGRGGSRGCHRRAHP